MEQLTAFEQDASRLFDSFTRLYYSTIHCSNALFFAAAKNSPKGTRLRQDFAGKFESACGGQAPTLLYPPEAGPVAGYRLLMNSLPCPLFKNFSLCLAEV